MNRCISCVFAFALLTSAAFSQTPDRVAIMVEALKRMDAAQVEANPSLKSAALKVADQVRGKPELVELVKKFNLENQTDALLETALNHAGESIGVEALRLILAHDGAGALDEALRSELSKSIPLASMLGELKEIKAVELLQGTVARESAPSALRKTAARSLCRTESGARFLLEQKKKGTLADDLDITCALALQGVRWPDVKREASRLFPPPQGANQDALPPLPALLSMKGDIDRGKQVFFRQTTLCASCHRVGDEGTDFGPALSEIGGKLGKDALYEAILDPSAGISFDYEGWEILTRSGEEYFGIIVSETDETLAVKSQTGIVAEIPKSEIESRRKQDASLMPAGLQAALSARDLVDLVEYLSSLKKTPPPSQP